METEARYAEVLLLSGQSKALNKNHASAIEDLERFIKLFPKDKQMSFGLMLLASNHAQLGHVTDAGRSYRRLWREFPSTYHAGTGGSSFAEHPGELRKGMTTPPGASKWDQGVW